MTYNISGWRPQPPDHRDYTLRLHRPDILELTLPPAASVRSILSPVLNQGGFGSCTAFGSLGGHEAVARKMGLAYPSGSRMAQYYWTRAMQGWQGQDTGAYIRDAVKVVANLGMADNLLWPYVQPNLFSQPSSAVVSDAAGRQATKYIAVPNDPTAIKQVVASGYPVIIGFSVPANFMTTQVATTGIIPMPSGSIIGGHCVLLTGYDDGSGRYEIQNSWSTDWGASGFAYMPYAFLQQLGSDFWMISEAEGTPPMPTPPMPSGTWMPSAIRRDGPTTKMGYSGALGTTSPKRGEIKHSAEGTLDGAFGILDGPSSASWHFTVAKDGRIFQHYPAEVNCWHGNDTDADQNVRANIDLIGVEHEGKVGEALTAAQLDATVRLTRYLAEVFGRTTFSRFPNQTGWTLVEHNEVGDAPTACPSNRIPWEAVFNALSPPSPPVPPAPEHRFLWGDANAGVSKYGKQQFTWNEGIAVDALGDFDGNFPGAHYHNEGGIWKQYLP